MFVYTGKLQWRKYSSDELLVIILPNGPVRVGDPVYISSQWSIDSKGFKKQKWFSQSTVDKVTRAETGDTFSLPPGYYGWEFQSQQGYQTITATMTQGEAYKSVMTVARVYQPKGETSGEDSRVWHGKLDWPKYASNEPFFAIVPEGFGVDKPALAIWQWSVNADGKTNAPCIVQGVQKTETPTEGSLTFSFTDYYVMTCTWDEKTNALSVHMEEPKKSAKDIGPFNLAAFAESHAHDITPPELPGETAELEVHYPQAEPALARIQTPMAFPRTLVDTLTHTASFLDQAGYQAKYAVDRYNTLDKSYHTLLQQNDQLSLQIRDLARKLNEETIKSSDEEKTVEALKNQLASTLSEAAKKEALLTEQVQQLQKALAKEEAHDAEDHKALDDAHEQIRTEQAVRAQLGQQVIALQFALNDSQKRIKQLQAQVSGLVHDVSELKGQLDAEKAHNAELVAQADDLKKKVGVLEADDVATKKLLARTAEDLKEAQASCDEKDKIIEGLEEGIVAIKKDRDAKATAYEELNKSTSATIQLLEEEIAQLKANGNPFPDDFPWPPQMQGVMDGLLDSVGSPKQSIMGTF